MAQCGRGKWLVAKHPSKHIRRLKTFDRSSAPRQRCRAKESLSFIFPTYQVWTVCPIAVESELNPVMEQQELALRSVRILEGMISLHQSRRVLSSSLQDVTQVAARIVKEATDVAVFTIEKLTH